MRRAAAEGRAYARVEIGASGGDPFADVEVPRRADARRWRARRPRSARRSRCASAPDLTVPEMATVLGEPLTTVEGRVYRALRKLREALA